MLPEATGNVQYVHGVLTSGCVQHLVMCSSGLCVFLVVICVAVFVCCLFNVLCCGGIHVCSIRVQDKFTFTILQQLGWLLITDVTVLKMIDKCIVVH